MTSKNSTYQKTNTAGANLQHRIDALIQSGTAKSTRRAYVRDVRYFTHWYRLTFQKKLTYPVTIEAIMQFVLDHTDKMPTATEDALINKKLKAKRGPIAVRTIRRYLSSLSVAHLEHGVKSPVRDDRVRLLLRRAQRARKHETPHQKAAITADILQAMLATCDDSLWGIRDQALLLVGFASGGRRRSELANMKVEDLVKIDEGYILRIGASKTDQAGVGQETPVLGEAAITLNKWLLASGLRSGKLFRAIKANNKLTDAITGYRIGVMIKKRIAKIGLNPKEFGAHSLRAGFITEAGRRGAALGDAMALSGHRDRGTAHTYYRQDNIVSNPASRLFD